MTSGPLFFLGAGASVPAGLPTTIELTRRIKQSLEGEEKEALRKVLGLVLGGIAFAEGQRGKYPSEQVNIELIAEYLTALRGRNDHALAPFVGTWSHSLTEPWNINEALQQLEKHIQDQVVRLLGAAPSPGGLRHLESLADFVRDYGALNVFSLNYDRCVEQAMSSREIECATGFAAEGWKPEGFTACRGVRLFKLHGSLDWYRDEDTRQFFSTAQSTAVPTSEMFPAIVFGTRQKLSAIDPYLYLSYMFGIELRKAPVIVVLGYSFGDAHVNDQLQQAIDSNPAKKLIVIDRSGADGALAFDRGFPGAEEYQRGARVVFLDGDAQHAMQDQKVHEAVKAALAERAESPPF